MNILEPFLSECRKGTFGPNCEFVCDCENGAACDIRSGTCICSLGYLGPKCQYQYGRFQT